MGVLNVTPDSFSDGGAHLDPRRALEHAEQMLADGADILDIGGESTRPGATTQLPHHRSQERAVSADEELRRILPVITELRSRHPGCFLSVDTYKAHVARVAVAAGADIVTTSAGAPGIPR
jgi:dihydropteroate synthase